MFKLALVLAVSVASTAFSAQKSYPVVTVPCEEMLKEVRASRTTNRVTAIEQARLADLERMASERCIAGVYIAADGFSFEAMNIMDK